MKSSRFRCSRRSPVAKSNAYARYWWRQPKGAPVELEAEDSTPRQPIASWTPVVPVPQETVAVAMFQWKRLPLTQEDRPSLLRVVLRDRDRLLGARLRRELDESREVRRAQRDHLPASRPNMSSGGFTAPGPHAADAARRDEEPNRACAGRQEVPHDGRGALEEGRPRGARRQLGHPPRSRRHVAGHGAGTRRRDRHARTSRSCRPTRTCSRSRDLNKLDRSAQRPDRRRSNALIAHARSGAPRAEPRSARRPPERSSCRASSTSLPTQLSARATAAQRRHGQPDPNANVTSSRSRTCSTARSRRSRFKAGSPASSPAS